MPSHDICPVDDFQSPVVVLNKVDMVAKPKLLPIMQRYSEARPFAEIVPVSAVDGTNVDRLEALVLQYLPDGEPMYPTDYVTDMTERVALSEIVREQGLRLTHEELPFSTAVLVDKVEETPTMTSLYCTILVDRESQKPIVIGRGGSMIKEIGTSARQELERYLDTKVFLDLHVKVRAEWRDDERALDELGVQR